MQVDLFSEIDTELPSVEGGGVEMVAENSFLMQIYARFFIMSREIKKTSIGKNKSIVQNL